MIYLQINTIYFFRYTPQLNFSAIPDGPDTDWAYWFNSVPKGAKTGKDNGFSLLFDIESYDYGYYEEGSEGLKVAIVHHLDMPIIRQRAFHVAPGTENQIPVTPTLYTTNDQVIIISTYMNMIHMFCSTDYFSFYPITLVLDLI